VPHPHPCHPWKVIKCYVAPMMRPWSPFIWGSMISEYIFGRTGWSRFLAQLAVSVRDRILRITSAEKDGPCAG
jgi:hypothetical protein